METVHSMSFRSSENRKHVRYHIDFGSMPIFDLVTTSSLGQLENITVGGCLVESNRAAMLDQVYHISMPIPGQFDERFAIRCTARSVWSSPLPNFSAQDDQAFKKFMTGYEFLDISEFEVESIEALIAILGRTTN
ncbi:MAG: PilZ domain-containing protein [Gammaproteobacteria bacterium]|nr:PilZ domain-containing protein [Gammaproteobacteria bacterium]